MVGVEDLVFVYQNADTAILVAFSLAAYVAWKRDVQPRLEDLEQTQEQRAEKWRDQHLSAQERDILLDDAHDRVDQVEQAVARLRQRLRTLENGVAAETGFYRSAPDDGVGDVDPDDAPSATATVNNDVDVDAGPKRDRRHGVGPRDRDRDSDEDRRRDRDGDRRAETDGGQTEGDGLQRGNQP